MARRGAVGIAVATWLAGIGSRSGIRGVAAQVDCGGHIEQSCGDCPKGQGKGWCNGACMWVDAVVVDGGQCLPKDTKAMTKDSRNWYRILLFFHGSIMLVFACIYKQKVVDHIEKVPRASELKVVPSEKPLTACFGHLDTCLHTTFCLPVVAAKNYASTEVCPFWMSCVCMFIGFHTPFYCVAAIVRAVLTGRVRDRLGYPTEPCKDLVLSFFCLPCEVGRESLEVDEEIGVEIQCCCRVTQTKFLERELHVVEEELTSKADRFACDTFKARLCDK